MNAVPAAVILDVDGTLYAQGPVRAAMLLRLVRFMAIHPVQGAVCFRALRAYRHAQETIRSHPASDEHAGREQVRLAAAEAGIDTEKMRSYAKRWMEHEPLDLIRRAARPGLHRFLMIARQSGARIGVFSDYPAKEKLFALGILDAINVVRSAQDDAVGRFKPNPRGLLLVAAELGVSPGEAVYIGDRFGVDDVAAQNAGMHVVIVNSYKRLSETRKIVKDFNALATLLFPKAIETDSFE